MYNDELSDLITVDELCEWLAIGKMLHTPYSTPVKSRHSELAGYGKYPVQQL